MDIFSKTRPDLISRRAMKHINKMLISNKSIDTNLSWNENIGHFYYSYIYPNLFFLIVLFLIILFLAIRYAMYKEIEKNKYKDKKKKKTKKKKNEFEVMYDTSADDLGTNIVIKKKLTMDDVGMPEEINSDENSIYNLEKEYQRSLVENNGYFSEQSIKDMYEEKSLKFGFDEIAKLVAS
jgi:hypothetical protein